MFFVVGNEYLYLKKKKEKESENKQNGWLLAARDFFC